MFLHYRTLLSRIASSAFATLILASCLAAQQPAEQVARDVHAHIETDRTVYRLGDTIQVRLRLQNVSSRPVHFWLDSPRGQVRLLLSDSIGHAVDLEKSLIRQPCDDRKCGWFNRTSAIGSDESLTLRWENREWLNLQDWGLRPPAAGTYTLAGIPIVVGPNLKPDTTLRSNEVTFSIEP